MDRIMQRFNCFNSIMQNSTTEDDKTEEIENEPDEEKAGAQPRVDVTLPETQPLDSSYSDAGYWKVDGCEEDLD